VNIFISKEKGDSIDNCYLWREGSKGDDSCSLYVSRIMDVFNDAYYLASLADSGEPCKKKC